MKTRSSVAVGVSGVLAAACLGGCADQDWADLPSISMSDPVAVLTESYSAGSSATPDGSSATRGGTDGSEVTGEDPDTPAIGGDQGPAGLADAPLLESIDESTLAELRLASEGGALDEDESALTAALAAAGFDGLGDFVATMSTQHDCIVVLTFDIPADGRQAGGPSSPAWARSAENRGILVLAALPWVDVVAADDADPATGVVVVDRDEAAGVVGGPVASAGLSVDEVREMAALLDTRADG